MNIKVLVKEPFKNYEIREIENTYEARKKIVAHDSDYFTYIEMVPIPYPNVIMIVNEESKLNGSQPNLKYNSPHVEDVVFGTVFFIKESLNAQTGEYEFVTMSEKELEALQLHLSIYFASVKKESAKSIDPDEYTGVTIITFGEL